MKQIKITNRVKERMAIMRRYGNTYWLKSDVKGKLGDTPTFGSCTSSCCQNPRKLYKGKSKLEKTKQELIYTINDSILLGCYD